MTPVSVNGKLCEVLTIPERGRKVIDLNALIGGGIAAALAALGVAYKFTRVIKSDGQSDKLLTSYMQRADRAEKLLDEERQRGAAWAKERAEYTKTIGELEAKVSSMEHHMDELQARIDIHIRANQLLLKILAEKEHIDPDLMAAMGIIPE